MAEKKELFLSLRRERDKWRERAERAEDELGGVRQELKALERSVRPSAVELERTREELGRALERVAELERAAERERESERRLSRAVSVSELMATKYSTLPLEGEWRAAFGEPESRGVWFVWGQSGSGKTTFVLQLCKELCRFGRVIYDSLEEGAGLTMRNTFERNGMESVARRLVLVSEGMDVLGERLSRRRSPDIVVIDSFQYTRMSFADYLAFKEAHRQKLLIFISQASGTKPAGRPAVSVMYDASLKIWVEGYRAFSKGRFRGERGCLDVWPEKAAVYWGAD